MAIIPPVMPIATTVKSTTVVLERRIADDDNPAGESANYQIVLLDQDGNRYRWKHEQGNIIPHWTPELIAMAQALMDASCEIAEGVLSQ